MNGAESALHTARAAGIDLCLANPGTTEMPLVAALDAVPGIRAVLGLFEGVCTGAADGYARMTGRPALTLLHLGPGFANGIANLHNARRARTPVVNLVGDHATWHLDADAPLTSDIVSLASPVSAFVRTTRTARELPGDVAAALAAACEPPGGGATLVVPADCQWEEAGGPAPVAVPGAPAAPDADAVAAAAEALGERAALLLGGAALSARGQRAAARAAGARGARVIAETFWSRMERGAGLPALERLPYFPEQALESLRAVTDLVLVGATDPVAFFGYPGLPSRLAAEGCRVHVLADPAQDAEAALEALADAVEAPPRAPEGAPAERPAPGSGALDPGNLGATLAAGLPEGAIVVDEGATSGLPLYLASAAAPPHDFLTLTGGAIGQGPPCATGAALACPDRRVLSLQADGSGMYTLQALWTQARESLDVTTVVCANRSYRILQIELGRAGIAEPGPSARALTDLTHPELDWCALARGMGVPGERVETAEELARALEASFREPGPRLVEAVLG